MHIKLVLKTALGCTLALATAVGAKAQANEQAAGAGQTQRSADPNLPNPSGGFIDLAPNPQGQTMLAYAWTQGTDVPPVISVSEFKGTLKRSMSYLGHNGEGTWMTADGSVYVLKGNVLTKTILSLAQLPKGLKNPSAAYLTYSGAGTQEQKPAAPAVARRPPHAPSASEQAAAPAGGHGAKILREASGVTLVYSGADGEHRYKVQRPAMGLPGAAAQQLNATDTGGWIYVAPDGASGILFNVTADHAVTATKLPAQALSMLVRREAN